MLRTLDSSPLNSITRTSVNVLKQFWKLLVEPFESLPQAKDRRRAIVTSIFLLFGFISMTMEPRLEKTVSIVITVFLLGGYFLARTRWFKLAASLLVVTLTIPSYLVALNLPNPAPDQLLAAFAWIVIPLLLTSLIFSIPTTILLGVFNLLLLSALPLVHPAIDYGSLVETFGFYGFTGVILMVVIVQRNQMERDRQKELIAGRELLAHEVAIREQFAEQSQLRANQLTMVNNVSSAISNLQSLNSILHLIFEQVRNYVKLDVFFIALYDEKTETVSFPVLYDGEKF